MAVDVGEVQEHMEKAAEEDSGSWHAIFIAVLALLLAICGLGGGNNGEDMMTSVIEMSDTYNYYQAKNVRQALLNATADDWELTLLAQPDMPEAAQAAMREKVQAYRATAARYESDPKTGEGKKELLAKAKELEEKHQTAVKIDPYFDFAETMLQIAIVLMSVYLLTKKRQVMILSYAIGALGALLLLNAFTMVVELPFL